MYGKTLLGVPLYGESSFLSEYVPVEDFTFNTYGIQNTTPYGIRVTDYTIDTPTRDFMTSPVPGNHGLILQEDWYRDNPIVLRGWINQPTKIQMDNKIHEVLRNLQVKEGDLIIRDGGNFKKLKTTLKSAVFDNQHYSTTLKSFAFTFSGTDSFWRDLLYTSDIIFDVATLSVDGVMNNIGSVETDPVVIVIMSAASNIIGATLTNTLTGETIDVAESLEAGDVLIFDGENKTVTINGSEVEYSGRFPVLQIGLNTYTIDLTGTSATYDVTAKFRNQYLTP